MPAKDFIFVVVLLLAIALALLCVLLDRRLARQRQENARLAEELAAARQAPPAAVAATAPVVVKASRPFAADFEQASLRQRLQRSDGSAAVPEKYRLVAAMAERGLRAEDIAAVLQLPVPEVSALLRLSMVSRGAA